MEKILIAGCGYIGERIAKRYHESGADVTCIVRSSEHAVRLGSAGFVTVISTFDEQGAIPALTVTGAVIFYLVPPPGGGISDSRARNFIARISEFEKPEKVVYISTTSVYSDCCGTVVTEESPTCPESAMGKRRLDAETAFREYGVSHNVPIIILRVSGIYGPGRLPLMQISQGQPLLKEDESGPSNRIHAEDLTAAAIAAAERGMGGDIFNISDGNPSSMTTYFNACADALGYPRQPQITLEEAREVMSPLMFSYVNGSRVIDNSRMRECLGVKLNYPTLAEGLSASVPTSGDLSHE